jgi:hypothetical protein
MKGVIHQEEISVLNTYAPNTGAPIYIKKKKMRPWVRSQHQKRKDKKTKQNKKKPPKL